MNWMLYLQEACANLISSKLRSFLAVLGIMVGTGSVVAMVSGGQLATSHALAQFDQLGTDLLSIAVYEGSKEDVGSKKREELTVANVVSLGKKVPAIIAIAPYTSIYPEISYVGHDIHANIIGSTASLQDVIKINMKSGRFISDYDGYMPYCILGAETANRLKKIGVSDPLYKQITINNRIYTVIGVAQPWKENAFFNQDINKSIIVPINSSLLLSSYSTINNIVMSIEPEKNVDIVQAQIRQVLDQIIPGKKLFFRSAKQLVSSMMSQRKTLTLLLALIGSISLIVGGIGVMNIMLVSVVERRREIGIRMAVGARRKDIRYLFLIEAVVLSLFGGLLGIIIGILTSYLIALFAGWSFGFFLLPPLIGFFVSVAVGIFFGFYPAYSASQLDPIQTLRAD